MKIKTQKGFTLTELLIVMAIIVVLAAVAVPTFGKQLETSRETGDMEVIRNAYTEALSIAILDAADGKINGKLNDGTAEAVDSTAGTWEYVSFKKNSGDPYYEVDLGQMGAKFSQRALNTTRVTTDGTDTKTHREGAWKYVSSTFMDRLVPIVDTSKTKLQFYFKIVTADDIGNDISDGKGTLKNKGLVVGDVVLKADPTGDTATSGWAIVAAA